MELQNKRVLLTGADGGIGQKLSQTLLAAGCKLGLIGLSESSLNSLYENLPTTSDQAFVYAADLGVQEQRQACVAKMINTFDGIDILINLAGINAFGHFEQQTQEMIEKVIQINSIAPMLLTHAVLPQMQSQKQGVIVNIGSTFGSIGFSCFTAYSASKFAMRGFSQALRRELHGSGISVSYIAPRAVDTPLNPPEVYEMAKEIKMNFDSPEWVASEIIKAIRQENKETYLGFPESLFARINGISPGMVDKSLNKQNAAVRQYAKK